MKQLQKTVLIALLIGVVFTEKASAVTDRLVFPVLADNHSITQNSEDPRNYGWFVNSQNGFGGNFPDNPVAGPGFPFHPAEDWNRTDGRDNNGNEPVYAIGNGIIARVTSNNPNYGGAVLVRYELAQEIDFTPYFLPNTTVKELYRRGRYIIGDYIHIAPDVNLRVGQQVILGQNLGTILPDFGYRHLHFEIMVDPNGNSFATTARNGVGYYESQQKITEDGYIDPTRFILG